MFDGQFGNAAPTKRSRRLHRRATTWRLGVLLMLLVTALPAAASTHPPVASATASGAVRYFAAPNGQPSADGSLRSPLDLTTALSANSPVKAGQTLYLRGGVYRGAFVSVLSGRAGAPVLVRAYPGEHPVLDSGTLSASALTVNGSYSWFRGFAVTKSDPNRVSSQLSSNPTDLPRANSIGVNVYGPSTKLIDLSIHDNGNGVGLWSQATNSELYGLLIYNNGWLGPNNGGHGHGIYVQNQLPSVMHITNCVLFNNYNEGLQVYTTHTWAQGIVMKGVTVFGSGAIPAAATPGWMGRVANLIIGSESNPVDQVSVSNSSFYQDAGTAGSNVRAGYGVAGGGLSFAHNVVGGGGQALDLSNWQQATVTGNLFQVTKTSLSNTFLVMAKGLAATGTNWNGNRYFGAAAAPAPFAFNGTQTPNGSELLSYSTWQGLSAFDHSSSYAVGVPAAPTISWAVDRYQPRRAFVTVFNWAKADAVMLDLSPMGLRRGSTTGSTTSRTAPPARS